MIDKGDKRVPITKKRIKAVMDWARCETRGPSKTSLIVLVKETPQGRFC